LGEETEGTRLQETDENEWRIIGWDLDCGMEDLSDGPRSVHVRLFDELGYVSQTLSRQVVVDRLPPSEGFLTCADGRWLISLETTMNLGVVKANEMWLEACRAGEDNADVCQAAADGMEACDVDHPHHAPVSSWTAFSTLACVRFTDESITGVRAKYRDLAHNETPWVRWDFANVTELMLDWVSIPGGTFEMGCSPDDTLCGGNELPVHPVSISPFEMLETEVTEGQYRAVTGETPSGNVGNNFEISDGGENLPVEGVDWYDAQAFCEMVGAHLPTEAQWEYAARAGTTTIFGCGYDGCLDDVGWHMGNSGGWKQDVGTREPNAFGLYDMLGNVAEWTADWYDAYYYENSPVHDPPGPAEGTARVYRGGSYDVDSGWLRTSRRSANGPSGSIINLGIRCVR